MNEPIEYCDEYDVELVRSISRQPLFEKLMLLLQLESIAEEANLESPK